MIEFMRSLSDIGFIAFLVVMGTAVMILLQTIVAKSVWTPYIVVFMLSGGILLWTLR